MFRVIDHTADIGLLVEGKNKEELFTESAAGMFSIIVGGRLRDCHVVRLRRTPRNDTLCQLKVTEATLEELLVSFLNELLYLSDKKKVIFNQFKVEIKKLKDRFYLRGQIKKNSQIPKREIKAATHHNLKVLQKKRDLWQTRIIFDI